MPRHAALTLIYLSRQTVARADFRAGRVPIIVDRWEQPRPELPDLASTVEYAISLGPRPSRSVWVLATDIWTQTLALTTAKVAGLKPADLERALNFEAESLSGIQAIEAAVGVRVFPPVRGEQPAWLVQVRTNEIDAVADAVRRTGSTLTGITHPGGLPRRLVGAADTPFERLELWPDAVIGVRRSPEGTLNLHVWNTDPPLGRWQGEVTGWLASGTPAGNPETLTAEGFAEPKDRPAPVVRMDDQRQFGDWFTAWAAELSARSINVPVVRPIAKMMSVGTRTAIALGLAGLVALACYAVTFQLNRQLTSIKADVAALRPDTTASDDLKKAIATRTADRDKKRAERVRLEGVVVHIEQHRERYARLLEVIAVEKPDDVLIQRIEQDGTYPKLIGVALRPELAHQYTTKLFEHLQPLGWDVQPAKEMDLKKLPEGGPWSFEVVIRDVPLAAQTPTPKQPDRMQ